MSNKKRLRLADQCQKRIQNLKPENHLIRKGQEIDKEINEKED